MCTRPPRSVCVLVPTLALLSACQAPEGQSRLRRALGAAEAGPGCGAVPSLGCCVGTTLLYCSGGQVKSVPCAPQDHCGWNSAFGMYLCGPSSSADPSGTYPRDCPADLGVAVPDAAGAVDAAVADAASSCGPLGYVGCCEGSFLHFCSGGQVLTLDCAGQPACGWNAAGGYYDCNTSGGADPGGQHPMSCTTLLGDSGVMLDTTATSDGGTDQWSKDLAADAVDALTLDSLVVADLAVRDGGGDGAADGRTEEQGVGLDASGLDVSGLDGGSIKPGGGGGCSGCAVGGEAPSSACALALVLLIVVSRRRR